MDLEFAVAMGFVVLVVLVFVLIGGLPYLAEWGGRVVSFAVDYSRRLWADWKDIKSVLQTEAAKAGAKALLKNFVRAMLSLAAAFILIYGAILLAQWQPAIFLVIFAVSTVLLTIGLIYSVWLLHTIVSAQKKGGGRK